MPSEKLEELRALAPTIDVLALGGSRMLNGFDPELFHRETRARGTPLRAYNLSLQRLLLWEQERMLDEALALPGLQPRFVLLEPAVGLGIAPENFTHSRTIEFETPSAWRRAVECILDSNRVAAHKAWNIGTHTLVLALHQANYGLFTRAAFPSLAIHRDRSDSVPAGQRGFQPIADLEPHSAAAPWLVDLTNTATTRFLTDSADAPPLSPALRRHFAALITKLRARGITPIFVQPPQLAYTTPELRQLTFGVMREFSRSSSPVTLLSYLDPAPRPHLYAPRLWSDYNHMRHSGAVLFTRDLARDLLAARASPPLASQP
jgi:hypothetical protein